MIPEATRIFVCTEPQDMRRSFDGLSLAAQEHLGEDPKSGALFAKPFAEAGTLAGLAADYPTSR